MTRSPGHERVNQRKPLQTRSRTRATVRDGCHRRHPYKLAGQRARTLLHDDHAWKGLARTALAGTRRAMRSARTGGATMLPAWARCARRRYADFFWCSGRTLPCSESGFGFSRRLIRANVFARSVCAEGVYLKPGARHEACPFGNVLDMSGGPPPSQRGMSRTNRQ